MSIKGLRRIFGLFTGSLLGIPKLMPKAPEKSATSIPGVRKTIRDKVVKQKRAARMRQKVARRTMRAHRK